MNIIKTLNTSLRLSACSLLMLTTMAAAEPKVVELTKGEKTITVFGTIHVSKPEWLPLPEAVTKKLINSDVLAVELDATDPKTIMEINKFIMVVGMSPDNNLATVADEKMLKQLNDLMGPMSSGLMQMRPWVAAVTVAMMRVKKMGFSDEAVDVILIDEMKKQNKPVVALEEASDQMGAFSSLKPEEEKKFLQSSLNDDLFGKELEMTISIWQKQDVQSAKELLEQMKTETPELYTNLFKKRNDRMVQGALELNGKHKKVFVAVGALHLYGEEGIIALLKKAGYK